MHIRPVVKQLAGQFRYFIEIGPFEEPSSLLHLIKIDCLFREIDQALAQCLRCQHFHGAAQAEQARTRRSKRLERQVERHPTISIGGRCGR